MKIRVKRLRKDRSTPLPRYMTQGASGMDLFASLEKEVTLVPGERKLIPTGISVAIPEGFEGQVRPRSGLAIQERDRRGERTGNDRCRLSGRDRCPPDQFWK